MRTFVAFPQRQRIDIPTSDSEREVECPRPTMDSRLPDHIPSGDRIACPHTRFREIGVRRNQATAVVDGHRPIGNDHTNESHSSASHRSNS
jgi:hypothetical protein